MPRLLRTYSRRFRSPPVSMFRSSSQVSISEETPTSLCSAVSPPAVRLVNRAVMPWFFRKSIIRVSIALTSCWSPTAVRLVMGSMTTAGGLELVHRLVDAHQVLLQAVERRAHRVEAQQPLANPLVQVEADRGHVPDDLGRRFLEGQVEAALAPAADAVGEGGGEAGLARAGGAGDQDAAAAIVALAAQHRVQAFDAGRDALAADAVVQAQRADRQDAQAVLVDHGRVLVGAVGRAAVFDDAQPAGGDLVDHAMVQEDHAIADVLLQAVAGERAARPARR